MYDATYSPDDNKLRLYAGSRLEPELYARVKDAGFNWAPRQELFYATWNPRAEDLLTELAGEIGDDDKTPAERAAERAERFEGYSVKRADDAERAERSIDFAKDIPLGQPILVGHHSEKRARKDAERIENGMRKAVQMWKTADYWTHRAAGCIAHAKYKEHPRVRAKRIKTIEADKRRAEKNISDAQMFNRLWTDPNKEFGVARALAIANHDHVSAHFTLEKYPRDHNTYEGSQSLWSALDHKIITPEEAREMAVRCHDRTIEHYQRWVEHYDNRLKYERAMMGEVSGKLTGSEPIEVGGQVFTRGQWYTVTKKNCAGGKIISVTTNAPFVPIIGIESISEYKAPTAEEVANVKDKLQLPPIVNYPAEGIWEMTKAEWAKINKDYKGCRYSEKSEEFGVYRYRVALSPSQNHRYGQVYITDAKRVDRPIKKATDASTPEPIREIRETRPYVPSVAETRAQVLKDALKQGVQVVVADQLFVTPPELAAEMVQLAMVEGTHVVLEPSAGTGNIVKAILEAVPDSAIEAIEINRKLIDPLYQIIRTPVKCADFLAVEPFPVDRAIMNPPFKNGDDIKHITHALKFLVPGGILVAICAGGPRQAEQLKPLASEWRVLPAGTFKESGTNVNTVLMVIEKDEADKPAHSPAREPEPANGTCVETSGQVALLSPPSSKYQGSLFG